MRSFDEIGRFKIGDEANKAYQVYASLYLDWVDDNISHFMWRDIDIRPIEEMKKPATEKNIEHAYYNAAISIARHVISDGYYESFEQFYKEYPTLRKYAAVLERFAA